MMLSLCIINDFFSALPYMEYMKTLNNKDPNIGKDSGIDQMYSCGRNTESSQVSNALGMVAIILIISFLIYRFVQRPEKVAIGKVLDFATDQEVFKMFISLLLLTNIKTLSNSLISNIILPMVRPILPFLSCNLRVKVGLFEMNIGEFVSDILVFGINIYLIFFVFATMY